MYKIYINQKPLILISDKQVEIFKDKEEILLARYPGKAKFLLNYIDMLEKGNKNMQVVLYDHDIDKLYRDLKTIAPPVKAAGGIVFNENNELLAIFRKGYWDLPKGHIHRNEKKKDAAIREVMEETGVKDLEI
ncbi:MAG TPA: NUDIX domain-containing protein, partial [Saprospiraceae bacterium]|nr:NUDIX domain-containing protein [Saprospiraceae bacterium]